MNSRSNARPSSIANGIASTSTDIRRTKRSLEVRPRAVSDQVHGQAQRIGRRDQLDRWQRTLDRRRREPRAPSDQQRRRARDRHPGQHEQRPDHVGAGSECDPGEELTMRAVRRTSEERAVHGRLGCGQQCQHPQRRRARAQNRHESPLRIGAQSARWIHQQQIRKHTRRQAREQCADAEREPATRTIHQPQRGEQTAPQEQQPHPLAAAYGAPKCTRSNQAADNCHTHPGLAGLWIAQGQRRVTNGGQAAHEHNATQGQLGSAELRAPNGPHALRCAPGSGRTVSNGVIATNDCSRRFRRETVRGTRWYCVLAHGLRHPRSPSRSMRSGRSGLIRSDPIDPVRSDPVDPVRSDLIGTLGYAYLTAAKTVETRRATRADRGARFSREIGRRRPDAVTVGWVG